MGCQPSSWPPKPWQGFHFKFRICCSNRWGHFWAPEDSNGNAWAFTTTGLQSYYPKNNDNHYVWAVRDGDVVSTIPTVPVPASIWLFGMFGSALVTFLAVERRKNTDKL
jgi:hypothetical protein